VIEAGDRPHDGWVDCLPNSRHMRGLGSNLCRRMGGDAQPGYLAVWQGFVIVIVLGAWFGGRRVGWTSGMANR